jgi:outer membrane protein assembly factor BamB
MALPTTDYIGAGTPNIAVTGGVLAGPLGTPVPTTAIAVINAAIKPLGYVSEDGLESQGERTVTAIKDWNADIIAQLQTEHSVRFGLTLYGAWDEDVLSEVFGADNLTVTPATVSSGKLITVTENGAVLPNRVWIFDMKTGGKKLRIVLPNAKVSEVTEKAFVAGELAGFQVTVEAFKDDAGTKAYRYYDDGVFDTSS